MIGGNDNCLDKGIQYIEQQWFFFCLMVDRVMAKYTIIKLKLKNGNIENRDELSKKELEALQGDEDDRYD